MAMRLFSSHPDVVAHSAYPLELRAFATAWNADDPRLVAGLQHYRDLAPFADADRAMIDLGRAPDQAAVRRLYQRIAEQQGKGLPRFATEKFPPRLDLSRALADDPKIRVMVLVRDPRDVIVSARAFDQKRGYSGFLEQPGDTDEDLVLRYAAQYERLVQIATTPDVLLVRYEDMVADPGREAQRVFGWLGIDDSDDRVAAAVRQALSKKPGRHLTAASVAQTVGRWHDSLDGGTVELVNRHMTAQLAALGYRA